jgi:hypothetical protein
VGPEKWIGGSGIFVRLLTSLRWLVCALTKKYTLQRSVSIDKEIYPTTQRVHFIQLACDVRLKTLKECFPKMHFDSSFYLRWHTWACCSSPRSIYGWKLAFMLFRRYAQHMHQLPSHFLFPLSAFVFLLSSVLSSVPCFILKFYLLTLNRKSWLDSLSSFIVLAMQINTSSVYSLDTPRSCSRHFARLGSQDAKIFVQARVAPIRQALGCMSFCQKIHCHMENSLTQTHSTESIRTSCGWVRSVY